MGIRDVLNKNKSAVVILMILLVAGAIALGMWLNQPGADAFDVALMAYYSVDDGRTYFVDAANKLTPFDHQGKQAYSVRVYRCPDKPGPVVGYLERIEEKNRLAAEQATKAQKPTGDIERLVSAHREVKRPGETTWVNANTPAGERVCSAPCANALVVMPENTD